MAINNININQSRNREARILENLRLDHLNKEERNKIQQLCLQFQEIFYLDGDKLHKSNQT